MEAITETLITAIVGGFSVRKKEWFSEGIFVRKAEIFLFPPHSFFLAISRKLSAPDFHSFLVHILGRRKKYLPKFENAASGERVEGQGSGEERRGKGLRNEERFAYRATTCTLRSIAFRLLRE
jgi:hypothetical protein